MYLNFRNYISFLFVLAYSSIVSGNTISMHDYHNYGIRFECNEDEFKLLKSDINSYFLENNINLDIIHVVQQDNSNTTFSIKREYIKSESTLEISKFFNIEDSIVILPDNNRQKMVRTVSKQEILIALMYPGRLTVFNNLCSINDLKDNVNVRQNIAAWSEKLNWIWPDGGAAKWNNKYWYYGTPLKKVKLHDAFNDIFFKPDLYAFGCFAASKIVYAHAILDYYRRIKEDKNTTKIILNRLFKDGEPLVDVEPAAMWYFEDDFNIKDLNKEGKILYKIDGVSSNNIIPGDWIYLLNTDKATYSKIGYEGSNAIYMGRNKFDDYYNDHNNSYSFEEKLNEVYQWRNKVFSRSRDFEKIVKLNVDQILKLYDTPENGGLLLSYRVAPYLKWKE